MSTLKQGLRGNDVRRLQLLLSIEADGYFGPRTTAAVTKFQRQYGLTADGVVGTATWKALNQHPNAAPLAASVADEAALWMAIAKAELGVHENSKPGKHTARILEYQQASKNLAGTAAALADETPWCSSFVNWVMAQSGIRGSEHALASSWLNWQWGQKLETPKYGAVAVIRRKGATKDSATGSATGNHVAFFVSTTSSYIKLLGGNQGDQVRYSSFSLGAYEVRGYLWPKGNAVDVRDLPTRLGCRLTV